MRRVVTVTQTICDPCGRVMSDRPGAGFRVGPLDFCRRCREPRRACQSCGSLPNFPKLQQTWAGNCLDCWRRAMTLPRGCCPERGLGWRGCDVVPVGGAHSCDELAGHAGAHHCPACNQNWGLW